MPPGSGFYPEGLTRKQVEQYVKRTPRKGGNLQVDHAACAGTATISRLCRITLLIAAFLEPAARLPA